MVAPSHSKKNGHAGRVLVLGARGMLGRAWRELLVREHIEHDAGGRELLDLTDGGRVSEVVTERYATVVNCCAYTDVDGAERAESEAVQVNGRAVGELARRCREVGATLVHYSTDYVFDGQATEPYLPDAPLRPVGAYGRSKAEGERRLVDSGCRRLLIRTSWLYAPWGKNFVRTIASAATTRDELRVVADQRGRPTSCEHLAATTLALLRSGAIGDFHVCDGGECSWYDFAVEIVRLVGADCDVRPCSTKEFPRPAPRPPFSVLDLSSTEAVVGPMPHWKTSLADAIGRLEP